MLPRLPPDRLLEPRELYARSAEPPPLLNALGRLPPDEGREPDGEGLATEEPVDGRVEGFEPDSLLPAAGEPVEGRAPCILSPAPVEGRVDGRSPIAPVDGLAPEPIAPGAGFVDGREAPPIPPEAGRAAAPGAVAEGARP